MTDHTETVSVSRNAVEKPRPLTRRQTLMAGLLGVFSAGGARAQDGAQPEPDAILYSRGGEGFPATYEAIEVWPLDDPTRPENTGLIPGICWVRLRDVPRWEVPSVVAGPQPEPVKVEVSHWGDETLIARFWDPADVPHCRLCPGCGAFPSPQRPGEFVCVRRGPAGLLQADAALYTEHPEALEGGAR